MKKFPSKPKRPKVALMRYYEDVIEEIKDKYPNKDKNHGFHRSIIKEMYDKLDKKEKKEKYIIPFRKEQKIWKKKLEAYEKKYKKKIKKLIGKKPKCPPHTYAFFLKLYIKKIKLENSDLNNYQIFKKIGELYKSKEKFEEVKEMKKEFKNKMQFYKIKKKEYEDKLNKIIKSDSESESRSESESENSNVSKCSDYEYNLKKRKYYNSKSFQKNIKKKKFSTNKEILKVEKKFINSKKRKISNSVKERNDIDDIKKELLKKLKNINLNDEEFEKIIKIMNKKKKIDKNLKIKEFMDKKSSENENSDKGNSKNSENKFSFDD